MRIDTVLCPIDFSGLDAVEIQLATEVCRAFGARLVLHHDVAAAAMGFSRAWEWTKAHDGLQGEMPAAERRVQALLDAAARHVRAEAAITTGPVGQVILTLARELPADLVVLGSHGWSTQDHASVSERLIDHAPCPVLTFQEGVAETHGFRLGADAERRRVVVATDLHHDARHTVAYACALARVLPIDLDLVHVTTGDQAAESVARVRAVLAAQVPSDLAHRVASHVRVGPAADTLVQYVEETRPAFVVVGEHARPLVRRLLTRDTARALLRGLRCPVWVVPPARAGEGHRRHGRLAGSSPRDG